jgi:hypothetical protein
VALLVNKKQLDRRVREHSARGIGEKPRVRHGELGGARVADVASRVESLANRPEDRDRRRCQLEPRPVKGRGHQHALPHEDEVAAGEIAAVGAVLDHDLALAGRKRDDLDAGLQAIQVRRDRDQQLAAAGERRRKPMGHLARAVDGGDVAQGAAFGRDCLDTSSKGPDVDPVVRPPGCAHGHQGQLGEINGEASFDVDLAQKGLSACPDETDPPAVR